MADMVSLQSEFDHFILNSYLVHFVCVGHMGMTHTALEKHFKTATYRMTALLSLRSMNPGICHPPIWFVPSPNWPAPQSPKLL
jgi:hypothetical protein